MNNVEKKEPVYTNKEFLELANKFGVNMENLFITSYDELVEINDALRLFDVSFETRKELENFFMKGETLKTLSPKFVFLCLKFNPRFYYFAQLLMSENKQKKLKGKDFMDAISKFLHKKTK